MLAKNFSGRVWENGEFGVSCMRYTHHPLPVEPWFGEEEREHQQWIKNCLQTHGAEATLEHYRSDASPFDLSNDFISHSRIKRGSNGITAYGRRLVRNAAFRLEQENKVSRLSFVTLTLPDVSIEESKQIGKGWASIVRVFVQKLRRRLAALGLPSEVLGVTEIQPRRTKRDGVLGLHLHLVFVGRHRREPWALKPKEIAAYWASVLCPYLNEQMGAYDWRAVENVQQVRKSAADYLGKYISKGVDQLSEAVDQFGEDAMPTAWFTISESLRSRTLSCVKLLSQQGCEDLIAAASMPESPFFIYRHPILVGSLDEKQVCLGWHGKLVPEYMSFFME